MSNPISASEPIPPSKLFLLGLLAAVFAVNVIDVFAPLLYPEIAATFGISVGTATQLSAFSILAGAVTGLALSFFSIKVRYKTLLMSGLLAIVVCVLGVFLAPNFALMQVFYAFNGVGSVIVAVMAPTLIGELYPMEKKAKRVSLILAVNTLATLIGSPVTGFIANTGGVASWRSALLWFMLPATVVCLFLVLVLVPNRPRSTQLPAEKAPFMNGYREVLTNKSAVACLSNSFLASFYFANALFASAFLSVVFGFSPAWRGLVPVAFSVILLVGLAAGGLLTNRVGRKRLLVLSAVPAVIFSVIGYPLSVLISNVWIVLIFRFLAAFFGGMPLVAGANLGLEQVPKFRGTMMSLANTLGYLGGFVGVLVGGMLLNSIGNPQVSYPVLMIVLGIVGLTGTLTVFLFARDPVKDRQLSSTK